MQVLSLITTIWWLNANVLYLSRLEEFVVADVMCGSEGLTDCRLRSYYTTYMLENPGYMAWRPGCFTILP